VSSQSGHPDPAILKRYAAGQLDPAATEALRAHLLDCESCRQSIDRSLPEATADRATPRTREPTPPEDLASLGETGPLEAEDDFSCSTDLKLLRPAENPAALGRIDEYEVLSVLGRGGMGIVLKAFDLTLHRTVALKILSPQLATSPKAHRRFLREARAAAGINHPNVVTIYRVETEAERPYLVMEYVHGRTLRERIRSAPPVDLASMVRIGAQIAAGLAAAHQQGVIHRDIKPTNIMLEDGVERVKITDFGLARVTLEVSELTSAEHAVGTPAYMSPEQVSGQSVDPRSDLFGLGCVMYAMATGTSPFHAGHPAEVAHRILAHVPKRLDEIDPAIPKAIADTVARLLEKDPNDRFQSAEEVRDRLQQYLVALAQNQSGPAVKIPSDGRRRGRRRRVLVASVAAAMATLAGAVALALWSWSPRPTPADTEPAPFAAPELQDLVTVAQSGQADSTGLGEALRRVKPGGTVRVLDDATYRESLRLDDPAAFRGVTIEAQGRPTLTPPASEEAAVAVRGAPEVTLRGFQIALAANQHGVRIVGDAAGVTLEKLAVAEPADSVYAAIHVAEDAHGSPDRPIRICDSSFRCGAMGVVIGGDAVAHVRIENNRFETALAAGVLVGQTAQEVTITGNVFLGRGVTFNFPKGTISRSIRVGNNTFFRVPYWLDLSSTELGKDVLVYNNLVLGAEGINTRVPLAEIAKRWSFHNNWWEPGPATDTQNARLVAEVRTNVELVSREPATPRFLRPPPGSPLAGAGAGSELPSHVGAFPPVAEDTPR
jgi:serine/threonine protein kinase